MNRSLISLFLVFFTQSTAAEYYVSPAGNDANAGTQAAPFATISKARDTIRTLKAGNGLPTGGVTVWLKGGYYNLASAVVLDSRDSGTSDKPIVYAAMTGEQPHITGARTLDPTWFTLLTSNSPVWSRIDSSARGKIYALNLKDHGITDFGTLKSRGYALHGTAPLELFSNGQPATLARWPNQGDPLISINSVLSDRQITYIGSRPTRWSQAKNIWAHGFWGNMWADYHLNVSVVDPGANSIIFESPPPKYGLTAGQSYYVYNLLEEIDEPGEYFVDRDSGILYYWPETQLATSILQVSMVETNLFQLNGAQFLSFKDLTLEASRGALIKIDAASYNRLEGCLLRNAGLYAVQITGSNSGLNQCELTYCGEAGAIIAGGQRATLEAGHNFVTNSRLHNTGRIAWTYNPGINVAGCGNQVSHNLIDEMPHSAVIFTGNDHVIEYNEIRQVCQLASDAGAIYAGRNWGYRGNIIRYNFIHHVVSQQGTKGANGVYLDDVMSSAEVFGNVFYRITGAAIKCGGGRDNIIKNNVIALCSIAHYNGDYARGSINNTPGSSFNLLERLSDDGVKYQAEPWASAYPTLAAIPNSWTEIQKGLWRNPENTVFSENVGWGNETWTVETNISGTGVFSVYALLAKNNPDQPALFDENASLDRSARAATLTAGVSIFASIPFASIGQSNQSQAAATKLPAIPVLTGSPSTGAQIELHWSDEGNLTDQQERGFDVEARTETGAWTLDRAFGPDVNFATLSDLFSSTKYWFRIRAYNAKGSVYSNILELKTGVVYMNGTATRVEAEIPLIIVSDVGTSGTVGSSKGTLDSQQSVRLYDAGDAIRINFNTSAGNFRLALRVRCGEGYWPSGYRFTLDGVEIKLAGDLSTVSPLDPSYGGCYWGTMYSDAIPLSAGLHSIDVTAVHQWSLVDYLEITPLIVSTPPSDARVRVITVP